MLTRWRQAGTGSASRVTTLELFFDLVFVFTITQLTRFLEHDLTWSGFGQVLLVFGVLWWMYGGYAWLTNQVSPLHPLQRLLLLAGMGGFMVTALAIPHTFDDTGVYFGLAYLLVVLVHLTLFSQSESRRGVARLAPFNLASAGLVLAAGFLDGWMVYALWALGLGIQVITPYLGVAPRFVLNVEHFVERHGLLMIVALGESVIAIGISVDTDHLTPGVVAAVMLGLGLPAGLWWSYFAVDHTSAQDALEAVTPGRRPLLAIRAYFYAHIPMLLGIVVTAAGIHEAIAHPGEHLPLPAALALAGGLSLFFLGDAAFRRVLAIGSITPRLLLAVAALATVPLGVAFPAWIQLAALVMLIVLVLLAESQATTRTSTTAEPSPPH